MRLLLQPSLAAADDGSVLERANDGRRFVPRRVLRVERVVRRLRWTVRSRWLLLRFVRVLHDNSFRDADANSVCRTHNTAHDRTNLRADRHADRSPVASANAGAFVAANDAADSAAHVDAHDNADLITDGHTDRSSIAPANAGAFFGADGDADISTDGHADGRTDDGADDPTNVASDGSADVCANPTAVRGSVCNCVCLTGGGMRRRSRRQLLQWRGRV